MGRGRNNATAAQATAPSPRTTFSPHWDEISRNIKRDIPGPAPAVAAPGANDLAELTRKVRRGGVMGDDFDGLISEMSEVLTDNLRAEYPDSEGHPPHGEPGYDPDFWGDVSKGVKGRLKVGLVEIVGEQFEETAVLKLHDMSRRLLADNWLRGSAWNMSVVSAEQLIGQISGQLPDYDSHAWDYLPDPDVLCREKGYGSVAEAFGTLSTENWVELYAQVIGGYQEWMRPDPELSLMDRYREQFAQALIDQLTNGTVKPKRAT